MWHDARPGGVVLLVADQRHQHLEFTNTTNTFLWWPSFAMLYMYARMLCSTCADLDQVASKSAKLFFAQILGSAQRLQRFERAALNDYILPYSGHVRVHVEMLYDDARITRCLTGHLPRRRTLTAARLATSSGRRSTPARSLAGRAPRCRAISWWSSSASVWSQLANRGAAPGYLLLSPWRSAALDPAGPESWEQTQW